LGEVGEGFQVVIPLTFGQFFGIAGWLFGGVELTCWNQAVLGKGTEASLMILYYNLLHF